MQALLDGASSPTGARQASEMFMWAGLAAVLVGGIYGLVAGKALVVVMSVLALVGFLVVRWSLVRRRVEASLFLAAVTVATVTFVAWILGGSVVGVGHVPIVLGLLPALVLAVAYPAGTIVARSLAARHPSLVLDLDDGRSIHAMLQISAGLLVLSPFLLSHVGGTRMGGVVAITGFVAAYTSAAGQLAAGGRVPHHVVAGGAVALLAHAWSVFQFVGREATVASWAGQGTALAGMVLSAFPVALGIVALQEVRSGSDATDLPQAGESPGAE